MAPNNPEFSKKPTVAAFDFDGTITTRDTFLRFLAWRRPKLNLMVDFFLTVHLLLLYAARLTGNETHKMALFARQFAGTPIASFQSKAREFARDRIPPLINPVALQRIKFHQSQGHDVVIVTASLVDWILPWAASQGIQTVIGSEIEIKEGLLTGRLNGPNCHGPEKLRRLLASRPDRSTYHLIAYGDSHGDRALLAGADTAYFRCFA